MNIIDSHVHFWNYDPIKDAWITNDMQNIQKSFLPYHWLQHTKPDAVDGCIAVQADQSETETNFLLGLAEQNHFIKGVVGWVNLFDPLLEQRTEFYSNNKLIKGFRHIVQAEKAGFLLQPQFIKGIQALQKYNFTYDILITEKQLSEAIAFVDANPNQFFVIDHIAKPNIANNSFVNWEREMNALAERKNVFCKISGLVTEADWNCWKQEQFVPYIDVAFNAFGANRVMFGSDWPVCLVAASYTRVTSILKEYVSTLSVHEQQQFWSETAINFYNLTQ